MGFAAVDLTQDRKPDDATEGERIESKGGRVFFDGFYNYRWTSRHWIEVDQQILRSPTSPRTRPWRICVGQWCLSHFPPEPSVRNLYLDFLNTLLERKEFQQCSSPAVMDMIRRLDLRVNEELGQVEKLQPLFGMLDAVLVA